ncbi:MAG: hypothetical protein IPO58_05970 [Betaproteobacteria bacterium]|nr:hypothetical protein [Betaproteobacteria bacterium]
MMPLRRNIQMVFQDPTASLKSAASLPRGAWSRKRLLLHTALDAADRRARRRRAGGSRAGPGARRPASARTRAGSASVNIARAIATNPRFVVLDEPTSALLDVSLRSRIILLLELRARHGLSYLFISHDLATVKYLAGAASR